QGGRNGHHWDFRLHTNPAEWGATTADPVAYDLLPHAADLARWLSGETIKGTQVARTHRNPNTRRFRARWRRAIRVGCCAWTHLSRDPAHGRKDGRKTGRTRIPNQSKAHPPPGTTGRGHHRDARRLGAC